MLRATSNDMPVYLVPVRIALLILAEGLIEPPFLIKIILQVITVLREYLLFLGFRFLWRLGIVSVLH
jgi:hypothetical protein